MTTPPPNPIDQDNATEFKFNPEVIQSSSHLHIGIDEDAWHDALDRYATSTSDIAELTQSDRLHHENIAGKFYIAYQFAFRTNLSGDLIIKANAYPAWQETSTDYFTDQSKTIADALLLANPVSQSLETAIKNQLQQARNSSAPTPAEHNPDMYDIISLSFGQARIVRLSDKGGSGLSAGW